MIQLTAETIAIVKATAPALRMHGVEITTAMYARLFQDASIKDMFDQAAQEIVYCALGMNKSMPFVKPALRVHSAGEE